MRKRYINFLFFSLSFLLLIFFSNNSFAQSPYNNCGCHNNTTGNFNQFYTWSMSKHAKTQNDVAGELADEWTGVSPDSVINGQNGENCVACHAPTAVNINNGITEAEALNNFFTTNGGLITAATTVQDTIHWPNVACTACHEPMNPNSISYFNSGTRKYETPNSLDELCGRCHGNLRFPDTDHLSYNILKADGGVGVTKINTMPGVKCVECHMAIGSEDGSNAAMFHGHTWSVFVKESDGSTFASCAQTNCHPTLTTLQLQGIITTWKTDFADSDATAQTKVAAAEAILQGSTDQTQLQKLNEAKSNLTFAESDESGGFHNHRFTMALLKDAITKADMIITDVDDNNLQVPLTYTLSQNYPNPFNPATSIKYEIAHTGQVSLVVFDVLGRKVKTLVNEVESAGKYSVNFNAEYLSSGIYIYQLKAGKFISTKKMLLMK